MYICNFAITILLFSCSVICFSDSKYIFFLANSFFFFFFVYYFLLLLKLINVHCRKSENYRKTLEENKEYPYCSRPELSVFGMGLGMFVFKFCVPRPFHRKDFVIIF